VRKAALAAGFAALVVLVSATPAALAWDDFGHMEVGAVAWQRMSPKARKEAARLLALNPSHASWIVGAPPAERDRVAFMRAGTWADAIRSDPAYHDAEPSGSTELGYADRSRHKPWHYVNQPLSTDGTPGAPAPVPNIATQIPILRAALASPTASDDAKSFALVWLLHLVEDVHQPVHCVARFDARTPKGDRGATLIKITGNAPPAICDDPRYCPYGPPDNLHILIDTIAGSGYAWGPPAAAARALPPADAAKAKLLDVSVWVAEGVELSRTAVYVPPIGAGTGPFTITPAYQAAMLELGKRRIALAGARLANVLNQALGK
jgi:hypothetical protein